MYIYIYIYTYDFLKNGRSIENLETVTYSQWESYLDETMEIAITPFRSEGEQIKTSRS